MDSCVFDRAWSSLPEFENSASLSYNSKPEAEKNPIFKNCQNLNLKKFENWDLIKSNSELCVRLYFLGTVQSEKFGSSKKFYSTLSTFRIEEGEKKVELSEAPNQSKFNGSLFCVWPISWYKGVVTQTFFKKRRKTNISFDEVEEKKKRVLFFYWKVGIEISFKNPFSFNLMIESSRSQFSINSDGVVNSNSQKNHHQSPSYLKYRKDEKLENLLMKWTSTACGKFSFCTILNYQAHA